MGVRHVDEVPAVRKPQDVLRVARRLIWNAFDINDFGVWVIAQFIDNLRMVRIVRVWTQG